MLPTLTNEPWHKMHYLYPLNFIKLLTFLSFFSPLLPTSLQRSLASIIPSSLSHFSHLMFRFGSLLGISAFERALKDACIYLYPRILTRDVVLSLSLMTFFLSSNACARAGHCLHSLPYISP